tara:strand:- start:66 stop:575 length:510 start_codon:yes stop_codon:yes gene_type:complete
MAEIKEVILKYDGIQIDYESTTYFPNGLIDQEDGVDAILVLTDKGRWSVNFSNNSDDDYNLSNVIDFLKKIPFKAIANYQIETDDTSGVSGELHLNGTIEWNENDGSLLVKNASEVIDNNWGKIGEREGIECVVSSTKPPEEIIIIFEDGSEKNIQEASEAILFIEQNT